MLEFPIQREASHSMRVISKVMFGIPREILTSSCVVARQNVVGEIRTDLLLE